MRTLSIRLAIAVAALGLVGASAVPAAADDPGPSAATAAAYQRLLDRFDANHDGVLQVAELPDPLRAHLGRADTDGDGRITILELHAYGVASRAVRFAHADKNGDGKLVPSEVGASAEILRGSDRRRLGRAEPACVGRGRGSHDCGRSGGGLVNRKLRGYLLLVVVFLLGAVVGGTSVFGVLQRRMAARLLDDREDERRLVALTRRLDLDSAEQQRVAVLLNEARSEVRVVARQTDAKCGHPLLDLREKVDARIRGELRTSSSASTSSSRRVASARPQRLRRRNEVTAGGP